MEYLRYEVKKTLGLCFFRFMFFVLTGASGARACVLPKRVRSGSTFVFFKPAFAFLFFSGGTALRFILWFALFLWSGFAVLLFFSGQRFYCGLRILQKAFSGQPCTFLFFILGNLYILLSNTFYLLLRNGFLYTYIQFLFLFWATLCT